MKRKIPTLLFLFLVNLINSQSFKQARTIVPEIFSESPNASIFKKFGDTPVSLYTGTPNINIHLYSNRSDIDLSVMLNYHIGGIGPDQIPSWVGLGWNLNVGGSVIRNVKGFPDEMITYETTPINRFSYFDNYQKLDKVNWASVNTLNEWMQVGDAPSKSALSPDEFIFNVNGLSGSFFMNHKGKWIVKSNQNIDLKINFEMKSYRIKEIINPYPLVKNEVTIQRAISGFTITDEKGFIYEFGYKNNSIEFSTNRTSQNQTTNYTILAKTWHLTKITSPNKQITDFNYSNTDYGYEEGGYPADLVVEPLFKSYRSRGSNFDPYSSGGIKNQMDVLLSLEKIYDVRLQNIISKDYIITFNSNISNQLEVNLSTGADWGPFPDSNPTAYSLNNKKHLYQLNNFEVKSNHTGEIIFGAKFNYLPNPNERLFLDNIETYGTDSSKKNEKHTFVYNSIPLPGYHAEKNDHWGFYNGIIDDIGTNPNNPYAISRLPNSNAMMAGILTKIIYPTGGFTVYQYEPNDFSKVVDVNNAGNIELINASSLNEIGGGIRIKKIYDYSDNSTTPITKEFLYIKDLRNNDLTSTGVLSQRPTYRANIYQSSFPFHYSSNNTIASFNSDNRDNVTYSKVYVKNDNGSYVENIFQNYDNGYMDKPQLYKIFFSYKNAVPFEFTNTEIFKTFQVNSLSAERGKLAFERKYSLTHDLVEENSFIYSHIYNGPSEPIRAYDIFMDQFSDYPDPNYLYVKANAYIYYTNPINLLKKSNTLYDLKNGTSITSTMEYNYGASPGNKHHQLIDEKINTSEGIATYSEKKYYYPHDLEGLEPFTTDLINRNMIGIPLKTEIYDNTLKIAEQKTVFIKTSDDLLLPKFIYSKKGDTSINNSDLKITYDQYDNQGNILQYTPESGSPVSIIWGYNKSKPIAKIENANNTQIALALGISNFNSLNESNLVDINSLRTNTSLSNSMITTYTYRPLVGITSITDPKNLVTFYEYDYFNRLQYIKDQDRNILKQFCYNYKGQTMDCSSSGTSTFYSAAKDAFYTKNNCTSGGAAPTVRYVSRIGDFTSIISQADADAKADAAGQAFANSKDCTFKNVDRYGPFIKNDCSPGYTGSNVYYIVPANTYSSTSSQADANSKADAAGQAYANTHGNCDITQISYTYTESTNSNFEYLTLTLNSDSPNHGNVTYKFRIDYDTFSQGGQAQTMYIEIVLAAGQTSYSQTFDIRAASYIYTNLIETIEN